MQESQQETMEVQTETVNPQPRQTFITRQQREVLKSLSKEVFGISSKYQRYLDGISQLQTKKVLQTVPGQDGAPDTTQEVEVAITTQNGAKVYKTKMFSFEETLQVFQGYKKTKDDYFAKMQAQEAEKKAKKEAEEIAAKIQESVAGSAI